MKYYFDVIVVAPLDEEFECLLHQFGSLKNISSETHVRFSASCGNGEISALLIKQSKMGRSENEVAFDSALDEFDSGLLITVGIAGALSNDLAIGDVCYSNQIIDVLDNAKVSESLTSTTTSARNPRSTPGEAEQSISFSPNFFAGDRRLSVAIGIDRLDPRTRPSYLGWVTRQHDLALQRIPSEFTGRSGIRERISSPKVFEGSIACGSVSASAAYIAALKKIDRRILAIETESGGMFQIAQKRSLSALTIRGISDYAGADKTLFELETGNNARAVAVDNAMSFLARNLESESVREYLRRKRNETDSGACDGSATDNRDSLENTFLECYDRVEEKLKALSPSYSMLSRGYRLPVPRARTLGRAGAANPQLGHPQEIRDMLKSSRTIMLHVPLEYPDLSLAYTIASDLLSKSDGDTKYMPCVLEGSQLQIPRHGIAQIADRKILAQQDTGSVTVVYIVNEFDFSSKTKTSFLREQVQEFQGAKFVVVTRSSSSGQNCTEFSTSVAATVGKVCEISFSEISFFLQKNFDMTVPASEVIASKLHDTFSRYALPTHPSYFVEIPRGTLVGLLRANRRAELIELAVAGYLSYVVLEDQDAVQLSRTTREKFLSELAFLINAKHMVFTEQTLTDFAANFAKKFDFDIKPARFVSSFLDKKILHEEGMEIRFTLPFMEAYLLARYLSDREDQARAYFDLKSNEFDGRTFALYAELGASEKIVQSIEEELDNALAKIVNEGASTSILLEDKIRPSLLFQPDRLRSIENQLSKVEQDVINDRGNTHEKQKLLDASDQIREATAHKLGFARAGNEEDGHDDSLAGADNTFLIWSIAVRLLGSGAQRLESSTKRRLIQKIVKMAAYLVDSSLRAIQKIDFNAVKDLMMSKTELLDAIAKDPSINGLDGASKFIASLTDYCEFVLFNQSLLRAMLYLCEEARDSVLSQSISHSETEGLVEQPIRDLWLADIDVSKAYSPLSSLFTKLPKTRFLRVAIVTHLMARVYWRQWVKEDRMALLRFASESLKGIGVSYDVGKMERMLDGLEKKDVM